MAQTVERKIPCEFLDFIREGKKFLIVGHENPDGDCIGSQLVLASVLKRLGKEAIPYSDGNLSRTEIEPYKSLFCTDPDCLEAQGTEFQVILVDCSALERAGEKLSERLKGLMLAVIDHHHHETGDSGSKGRIPAGTPCYFDSSAPSTTVMVMKLIAALGLEITREEAELLFFGLCTDTGFFRHADENAEETFEAALTLIRLGANPKAAYSAMHGGKSLDSRRLIGQVLSRAESLFDGKLILSSEEYEDIRRFGSENRDSDSLYKLLTSVDGVEAIVIIRQETPETFNVGLRSCSHVDVGSIAGQYGGGGHKNAAGFTVGGTIAELRQKIIKTFESVFPKGI